MKKTLLAALLVCSLMSARAAIYTYSVYLDGPSEPTPSLGTGSGTVIYDDFLHTLGLQVSFAGLTGITTVSHIHAATALPLTGTAGVATSTPTFPGFPAGVTSGSYSATLDLTLASSFNPSYVTANGGTLASAEAALAAAMASGKAYWNIHSSVYGGGEIRGFLVPEPSSLSLFGLGAIGLASRAWRKKHLRKA